MSLLRSKNDPELLPIVAAGDPVLRTEARPLSPDELASGEMQSLIDRMIATMRAAPGVGLAAPQVGVPLSLFVMEDPVDRMKLTAEERALRERVTLPLVVVANPNLTPRSGRSATFFEGCLSVPGYMALVERSLEVELSGLDREGRPLSMALRGWPARIAQHEYDHLRGTLYVDRMHARTFGTNREIATRWIHEPVEAVMKRLGG
jgi:peptide deformylase